MKWSKDKRRLGTLGPIHHRQSSNQPSTSQFLKRMSKKSYSLPLEDSLHAKDSAYDNADQLASQSPRLQARLNHFMMHSEHAERSTEHQFTDQFATSDEKTTNMLQDASVDKKKGDNQDLVALLGYLKLLIGKIGDLLVHLEHLDIRVTTPIKSCRARFNLRLVLSAYQCDPLRIVKRQIHGAHSINMKAKVTPVESTEYQRQSVRVIIRARHLQHSLSGVVVPAETSYLDVNETEGGDEEGNKKGAASAKKIQLINPRNQNELLSYAFNAVYVSASQDAIFQDIIPVMDNVLRGKNASIFAYGQTGSGKTFTMLGSPEQPGVIPRAIEYLLRPQKKTPITIHVSFMEIYNEKIIDLLNDSRISLELRERENRKLVVSGLSEHAISTIDDFSSLNRRALASRSTAETQLNAQSSRSHLILSVQITSQVLSQQYVTSKLFLIDLAGSEDNKRTGNVGDRMVESSAINKSLFVLGQVVEAVNRQSSRIPYRDSKITRLLQDCLGGSALGVLIACVAPNAENSLDTINTLNFASKAGCIKNDVVVNEKTAKPKDLKAELEEWKRRNSGPERDNSSKRSRSLKSILEPLMPASSSIYKAVSASSLEKLDSWKGDVETRVPLTYGRSIESHIEAQVAQKVAEKMQEFQKQFLKPSNSTAIKEPSSYLLAQSSTADDGAHPNAEPVRSSVLESEINLVKAAILNAINTGDLKSIMKLNLVGKKRAEAMQSAWKDNGPFQSMDDLKQAGLSEKQLHAILKANVDLTLQII